MSTKSKSQLQEDLAKLQQLKAKLVAAKESTPDKFTEKHQAKLDDVVEKIFDLEEQLSLMSDDAPANEATPAPEAPVAPEAPAAHEAPKAPATPEYVPAAGTEKRIHLSIVRGRRFNPNTGKEESKPCTQIFSPGEFQLFKANAARLGYTVVKVLHDPTGTASSMVTN